jgi:hypothetical protein
MSRLRTAIGRTVVILIVVVIVLAAFSVYEYTRLLGRNTRTAVTPTEANSQLMLGHGIIQLSSGGTLQNFTYVQWNSSMPNALTISDVRFTLWTNTTVTYSGGSCYGPSNGYGGYIITFADGSTETMTTCTVGPNPRTTTRLTAHINPQAGLFIVPSTGAVYFLVSVEPTVTSSTVTVGTTSVQVGTTTTPASATTQQGAVETVTRIATSTMTFPSGTTTVTECSRTGVVTVTTIETTGAQTTVTITVTTTATNYGSTTTVTTCAATTTTTTVTQGGG